jgi:hypothetical protein
MGRRAPEYQEARLGRRDPSPATACGAQPAIALPALFRGEIALSSARICFGPIIGPRRFGQRVKLDDVNSYRPTNARQRRRDFSDSPEGAHRGLRARP